MPYDYGMPETSLSLLKIMDEVACYRIRQGVPWVCHVSLHVDMDGFDGPEYMVVVSRGGSGMFTAYLGEDVETALTVYGDQCRKAQDRWDTYREDARWAHRHAG